jgi:hypothetical protein
MYLKQCPFSCSSSRNTPPPEIFIFLYPGTKGTTLFSKRDKTHIHNPEYEATAHFMHVRQLLTASCVIIAQQCIIHYSNGFPPGKEITLLETCHQL